MSMSFRATSAVVRRVNVASRLSRPQSMPPCRLSTAASPAAKGAASPAAKEASSSATRQESVPVAKSLLAMTAAVATVSAGAALVESAASDSCPPFDPRGQRFDQSTFAGRFSKMFLACDPRLLFYSDDEVRRSGKMVQDHQSLLANPPAGTTKEEMNRALWEAMRISSAALHPDTGDTIPHPFRMSGYVPFNGPVCVAMVASTSTPALLFWSWANQSQNALVNYFNRNASSEMTNETLIKSYAAAVGSALTVAFGLATLIQKKYSPSQAKAMMRWVAFPSAVVASSLNCYIVRSPEIDSGVPLVDSKGNDVLPGSTSNEAAKRGVHSTTASRAILQAPVYFLPPVLLGTVPILKNYLARHPAMTVPITTYVLLVIFGFGLPGTVAIFPQMSEIAAEDAEEEYRLLRDESGRPYEKFWYNKGL